MALDGRSEPCGTAGAPALRPEKRTTFAWAATTARLRELLGALAVSHAFSAEQDDPCAGRTVQGISLWAPDAREVWWEDNGPEEYYLPNALWLVGLGNLGQAYLWALSWLPYADPTDWSSSFRDGETVRKKTGEHRFL